MVDKRFKEVFDRLDEVNKKLDSINDSLAQRTKKSATVTKAQLMAIKGVGDTLADDILKVING